ncbi:hypothetical protein BGX38DRAFT_1140826 [Terfezia claveryi]|nr:hypothetical protein BGX38DRAFT_1140826 [Terfezia claveryi]
MAPIIINLREQLREFLNDNEIIIQEDMYLPIFVWHFGDHIYNLSASGENHAVDTIVAKWEQEGIKDMGEFESKLGMTPEAVVTMVRELVDTEIQAFLGLNNGY